MAKQSMINREFKRTKLANKFADRRKALKDIIASATANPEEKWKASIALQKQPRDASKSRGRNRCRLTGRPHAVYSKFGLSRTKLREAVMRGDVPGAVKASW